MADQLEEIVDKLSGLKVVELAKLKELLESKWGVKAMVAAAAPAQAVEAKAEATEFHVVLTEVPADKKIGVIKIVREITGLGLKEAMDLVNALPKNLKESTPKADAEALVKRVQDAGGKATLKPV